MLIYPFQTVNDASIQQFIQEWESPDFHERTWKPLLVMILTLIGSGMISSKRISTTSILLCLALVFATLVSLRHVAILALVSIPVVSDQLGSIITFQGNQQASNRLMRWITSISLILVVLVIIQSSSQFNSKQLIAEIETFPKGAVDWIVGNEPKGNIFNSYNWGGYLIWKLYPDYRVFIDGRCDMYGAKFVSNYVDIYSARPGWEAKLVQNDVNLVLVEKNTYLAEALGQSPVWQTSFEDELSIIYTKK
jgi:hypothetical protein